MNMKTCIVVPCYNEAARLDRARFAEAFAELRGVSFIFVDDGSTDGTLALLESIAVEYPATCSVLALPANAGKAEAVRQGMNAALTTGAQFVGYWDADLATPLDALPAMLAEVGFRPAVEVVLGSRVKMLGSRIDRSPMRHLVGRAFATLASLTLRLPVYDTQCGAKLFRASHELRRAVSVPFRSRWGFDVELLQRLQLCWGGRSEARMLEVPLRTWTDVGESKVSMMGGLRAFASLFALMLAPTAALPELAAENEESRGRVPALEPVAAGGPR